MTDEKPNPKQNGQGHKNVEQAGGQPTKPVQPKTSEQPKKP